MNRQIVYTGQLPLSKQGLKGYKSIMKAIGQAVSDIALSSGSPAVLAGLSLVPTSPASMSLTLNPGAIYQLGQIDFVTTAGVGALTDYGSLPADSTEVVLQGIAAVVQTVTGFAAPGTSGQSINYLVQFQVQMQDSQQTGDGIPAVLTYYNSANPTVPLSGQGGNGAAQNSERSCVLAVQVVAGTAAATGSQTTPAVTAGWLAGYVVTVAFGQGTILAGNVTAHSQAPFLAPLTAQHHLGLPGTAPKIDLTKEVQGQLPLANIAPIGVTNLTDLACSAGEGLTLNYNAGNVIVSETPTPVAAGTLTMAENATSYVYIDTNGTPTSNTTGWPSGGSIYPLATVAAGASAITSVTDKRGLARVVNSDSNPIGFRNYIQRNAGGLAASATPGAVDLQASSSDPFCAIFANGYNGSSPVDVTGPVLTSNQDAFWSGLVASATNYLFVKNVGGTLTGVLGPYPQLIQKSAPAISATTPIAYWHFSEASGASIADSGGTFTGTATGTTVVAGQYGNARQFNGSSDYIVVTGNPPIDDTDFTIAGWINVAGGGLQAIISKGFNTASTDNYGYQFGVSNSAGNVTLSLNREDGTATQHNLSASSTFPINTPTHVAVTFEKSTGAATLYINAAAAGSGTLTTADIGYSTDTTTRIGAAPNSGSGFGLGNFFDGWIDELSMFTSALSQPEIQLIMASSTGDLNTGKRYYNPVDATAYIYQAGAWSAVQEVSVGEADADSSGNASSVRSYAAQGLYSPGRVSCSASTAYTVDHYLGTDRAEVEVFTAATVDGALTPCAITSFDRTSVAFTTPAGAVEHLVVARRI